MYFVANRLLTRIHDSGVVFIFLKRKRMARLLGRVMANSPERTRR